MNNSMTNCISELAQRARETGEEHTAVVLFALAAHRAVGQDRVMAIVAEKQSEFLKKIILNKFPDLYDPKQDGEFPEEPNEKN